MENFCNLCRSVSVLLIMFSGLHLDYGNCQEQDPRNAHTYHDKYDRLDEVYGFYNPIKILESNPAVLNPVLPTQQPLSAPVRTLHPPAPNSPTLALGRPTRLESTNSADQYLIRGLPLNATNPVLYPQENPRPLANLNRAPPRVIFATTMTPPVLQNSGPMVYGSMSRCMDQCRIVYGSNANQRQPSAVQIPNPIPNTYPVAEGQKYYPATYGPKIYPAGQNSVPVMSQALQQGAPRVISMNSQPYQFPQECRGSYSGKTANLQRLYSKLQHDHLYVTEMDRKVEAVMWGGYKYEKNTAKLAMEEDGCPCLKKLYRLKNSAVANLFVRDHFYTINKDREMISALEIGYKTDGPLGLEATGIHRNDSYEGFCVENKGECGATVPIYQLFFKERPDHFLTSRPEDRDEAIAKGYEDNGVECWAWPPDDVEHCC